MDIRSFATAVQYEEIGHRVSLDIERVRKIAEFDANLCFGDEEESRKLFESAASKFAEAQRIYDDAMGDFMAGFAVKDCDGEMKDVLNKYVRNFRS